MVRLDITRQVTEAGLNKPWRLPRRSPAATGTFAVRQL
jgi:hypothetical protein